jgi:hypothetical protein
VKALSTEITDKESLLKNEDRQCMLLTHSSGESAHTFSDKGQRRALSPIVPSF